MKFDRDYTLSVETQPNVKGEAQNVVLTLPYTIDFDVQRGSLATANTAKFVIKNLGEKTRNLIYADPFYVGTSGQFRAVQFRAGYKPFTPLLFNGSIKQAYSEKQSGSTNYDTTIECYDGGFPMVNGWTSRTVGALQSASQIIRTLNDDLPGVSSSPIVGDFPTQSKRGTTLWGNTWQLIQQLTSGLANIDNGQVKALQNNEVIEGQIPVISAATGLLGSPLRKGSQIIVETLFEPRYTVGQVIELRSETNSLFNGQYKVMGFHHQGTISPAVGGACKTTVNLWLGSGIFNTVMGVPVQ